MKVYGLFEEEFRKLMDLHPKVKIGKIEDIFEVDIPNSFIDFEEGIFIRPVNHYNFLRHFISNFYSSYESEELRYEVNLYNYRNILCFHTDDWFNLECPLDEVRNKNNGYWYRFLGQETFKMKAFMKRFQHFLTDFGFNKDFNNLEMDCFSNNFFEAKKQRTQDEKIEFKLPTKSVLFKDKNNFKVLPYYSDWDDKDVEIIGYFPTQQAYSFFKTFEKMPEYKNIQAEDFITVLESLDQTFIPVKH